jgi:8-oxo-dGTP pyrophosphatase MutT (NUDIX family)
MARRTKRRKHELSCGAIVLKHDASGTSVLLVKQRSHDGVWGMPKGHINPGETLEACARREVLEETGVSVSILSRAVDCTVSSKDRTKLLVSFFAEPAGSADVVVSGTSDVDDAQWFNVADLPPIVGWQSRAFDMALDAYRSTQE